jgi:hypothetical protein
MTDSLTRESFTSSQIEVHHLAYRAWAASNSGRAERPI